MWSGDGAGNFHCRDVLPFWIIVGKEPVVLSVGVGCLDIILCWFFFLPLSGKRSVIDHDEP